MSICALGGENFPVRRADGVVTTNYQQDIILPSLVEGQGEGPVVLWWVRWVNWTKFRP